MPVAVSMSCLLRVIDYAAMLYMGFVEGGFRKRLTSRVKVEVRLFAKPVMVRVSTALAICEI